MCGGKKETQKKSEQNIELAISRHKYSLGVCNCWFFSAIVCFTDYILHSVLNVIWSSFGWCVCVCCVCLSFWRYSFRMQNCHLVLEQPQIYVVLCCYYFARLVWMVDLFLVFLSFAISLACCSCCCFIWYEITLIIRFNSCCILNQATLYSLPFYHLLRRKSFVRSENSFSIDC